MKKTTRLALAAVTGLALIVPATALAKTTHWFGSAKYGVIDKSGDVGNFNLEFNVSHDKVTYWFIGYACNMEASPGSANFPTRTPINHGRFRINYTEPTGRNPVSHEAYDTGFHVIITGQFKKAKASGTIDVLNDPDLGGACDLGTKHWHAHRS